MLYMYLTAAVRLDKCFLLPPQDTVADMAKDMRKNKTGAAQASAAELYDFMNKVRPFWLITDAVQMTAAPKSASLQFGAEPSIGCSAQHILMIWISSHEAVTKHSVAICLNPAYWQ